MVLKKECLSLGQVCHLSGLGMVLQVWAQRVLISQGEEEIVLFRGL
jgi:hypothetical protein